MLCLRTFFIVCGVTLVFCFSHLTFAEDLAVPQYLINVEHCKYDPETGSPVAHQIRTVHHDTTDPRVLIVTLDSDSLPMKLRFHNLEFLKYFKNTLEGLKVSYYFAFRFDSAHGVFDYLKTFLTNSVPTVLALEAVDNEGCSFDLRRAFLFLSLHAQLKEIVQNRIQFDESYETVDRLLKSVEGIKNIADDSNWNEEFNKLRPVIDEKISGLPGNAYRAEDLFLDLLKDSIKDLRKVAANRYALESQANAIHRRLSPPTSQSSYHQSQLRGTCFTSISRTFSSLIGQLVHSQSDTPIGSSMGNPAGISIESPFGDSIENLIGSPMGNDLCFVPNPPVPELRSTLASDTTHHHQPNNLSLDTQRDEEEEKDDYDKCDEEDGMDALRLSQADVIHFVPSPVSQTLSLRKRK